MDTVVLHNKKQSRMILTVIKDITGKPVILEPEGQEGDKAIVPSFDKDHTEVVKLVNAKWVEVHPGPKDGEALGKVTGKLPHGSPLKSAEALKVPPGDGSVVGADPAVTEEVYLGDPSNPLPHDMSSGAEHIDPPASPDDQPRRRKKHE